MACYDGTIRQYDSNKQEMSLSRNPECHGEHGDIRKVHYCSKSNLLVFAYENGKVHIRKCSIGNFSGNFTWRESCLSLSNDTGGGEELLREVEDVECLLLSDDSLDVFEIWLGINSDVVEVWSMPLSPGTAWAADTVSHIRTIAHVTVAHSPVKGEVRKVQKSLDESMMVTVFFADHKNSVEIGIVSVETKKCLRILDFKESGMYVCVYVCTYVHTYISTIVTDISPQEPQGSPTSIIIMLSPAPYVCTYMWQSQVENKHSCRWSYRDSNSYN